MSVSLQKFKIQLMILEFIPIRWMNNNFDRTLKRYLDQPYVVK